MKDFLFVFGYESPEEWSTNREHGTDFESSMAVWIAASDEELALLAGRSHAERWVHELFREQQVDSYPGWSASGYAHWIELEPLRRFSGVAPDMLDRIQG